MNGSMLSLRTFGEDICKPLAPQKGAVEQTADEAVDDEMREGGDQLVNDGEKVEEDVPGVGAAVANVSGADEEEAANA